MNPKDFEQTFSGVLQNLPINKWKLKRRRPMRKIFEEMKITYLSDVTDVGVGKDGR